MAPPCLDYPEKKTSPPFLPHEVIIDIVSRLPVKSLIRCSCVCKEWFKFIHHDPQLVSSHFVHSQKKPRLIFKFVYPASRRVNAGSHFYCLENNGVDFRKIVTIKSDYKRKLIGYCNGLVCFHIAEHGIIEVCNPTRREILGLYSPIVATTSPLVKYYGFGFDSLTKEYKVIYIVDGLKCLVYTLGNNSWREITSPHPHGHYSPWEISAIFCSENNALYWKSREQREVISFDLHREKFQVIQLPWMADGCGRLLVYKGYLCVAELSSLTGKSAVQKSSEAHLHILKDNKELVWDKATFFVPFSPPYITRVMGFSDHILLYWLEKEKKHFRFYNLHTGDDKIVERPRAFDRTDYCLINHVENFLSLQTFVQKGTHGVLDFYPPLERIVPHRPRRHGILIFCCSFCQNPESGSGSSLDELYA